MKSGSHNRINIVKVDSEFYTDNQDGEEISGTYTGSIRKDEDGKAFIHLDTVDGEDVLAFTSGDKSSKRKNRDDDDEDEDDDGPRNAGEALDIFMVDRQNSNMPPPNAPPGYQSV